MRFQVKQKTFRWYNNFRAEYMYVLSESAYISLKEAK